MHLQLTDLGFLVQTLLETVKFLTLINSINTPMVNEDCCRLLGWYEVSQIVKLCR